MRETTAAASVRAAPFQASPTSSGAVKRLTPIGDDAAALRRIERAMQSPVQANALKTLSNSRRFMCRP